MQIKVNPNIVIAIISLINISCEEIIDIDLKIAEPIIVVEANIYKDSTAMVRLSLTDKYFSADNAFIVEDATIIISDNLSVENLSYAGEGYYTGSTIIGREGITYNILIQHGGSDYKGTSRMPHESRINSFNYSKSSTPGALNPFGDTVFTIKCEFTDIPGEDNYYLLLLNNLEGQLLERFYLLTEKSSNSGSINNRGDTISFSESIFYDGGEIIASLYCIDEAVYNYFGELNDVLFWQRRVMSPSPYNPESNINNGALGFFAAWSYDSVHINLQ